MSKKIRLILSAMVLVGAGLVALVLYQWSVLVSKKLALASAESALAETTREVDSARAVLDEVSRPDYQSLTARKKGFGVKNEVGYSSIN